MNKDQEKLFNDNLKLAYYVLNEKFQGKNTYFPGNDYGDLTQVAYIGLWKACITFKPDKKINFSTYAIKVIYNEILMLKRSLMRNKLLNDSISLEYDINDGEGNETTLSNFLIYDNTNDISLSELKSYIYNLYKNSEIKLSIINDYVFNDMTQCELGKKYNYSQAQISRIIKKFKNKLKKEFLI